GLPCRRLRELEALAAAVEHLQRPRHRLGARAGRPPAAVRRPPRRVVHGRLPLRRPPGLRRGRSAAARGRSRGGPSGKPTKLNVAGNVVFGDIVSTLDVAQAKQYTEPVLLALGRPPGVVHTYVTGAGPIQHDLDPIFSSDLRKGESIAIPIALAILLAVFGISFAVTIPFVFAACTITGSLGILYGIAQLASTPTSTTNLIELIGLGIAIDYSLLVVYRFREELAQGHDVEHAVVRTMSTAGRAVIFSGIAVA